MRRFDREDIWFRAASWFPIALICGGFGLGIWAGLLIYFLCKENGEHTEFVRKQNTPFHGSLEEVELNKKENLTETDWEIMRQLGSNWKISENRTNNRTNRTNNRTNGRIIG